jgi:hypothetical protein
MLLKANEGQVTPVNTMKVISHWKPSQLKSRKGQSKSVMPGMVKAISERQKSKGRYSIDEAQRKSYEDENQRRHCGSVRALFAEFSSHML